MRYFKPIALLITGLTFLQLAACARPGPTATELASADYGAYPENYEQLVKDYTIPLLLDPTSPIYEFDKPQRGYYNGKTGRAFGYYVCFNLNAKNRFGGYTGSKREGLFIKDNVVVGKYYGGECL